MIPNEWFGQIAHYELEKRKGKEGSFVFIKISFFR
jgi:hypothetical protein